MSAAPPAPRRRLLFDDLEVESRPGLRRTVHQATKHAGNPILAPGPAWEGAMVPSTVLYDAAAGRYKLWYLTHAAVPGADSTYVAGYATSGDGLTWERPDVGAYEYEGSRRNNLCLVNTPGGMGVIEDGREADAARRFKALFWRGGNRPAEAIARGWGADERKGFYLATSPDGARWALAGAAPVLTGTGDTQSLFGWDETCGRYVSYVRPRRSVRPSGAPTSPPRRVIARSESEDLVRWTAPLDVLLPDADDPPGAELYFMPVQRYHGHYVGIAHVFVPAPDPFGPFWPELTHSRDGVRWRRLNDGGRQRLLRPGPEGSFDGGMIRCARGFFERGDTLWLYYGGWHEDHGVSRRHRHMTTPRAAQRRAAAIGLATLRRDGFVSLDAGDAPATLTTAPFTWGSGDLRVNARIAPDGEIAVAVLGGDGCEVAGFGLAACAPLGGDRTDHAVTWPGTAPAGLRGERLRLRFRLRRAELFAYEV
jgi:hypothetical protein